MTSARSFMATKFLTLYFDKFLEPSPALKFPNCLPLPLPLPLFLIVILILCLMPTIILLAGGAKTVHSLTSQTDATLDQQPNCLEVRSRLLPELLAEASHHLAKRENTYTGFSLPDHDPKPVRGISCMPRPCVLVGISSICIARRWVACRVHSTLRI